MASSAARRRFTTAEYERMAETGILHEDDRSELIAGEIIQMNPLSGRHIQAVNRLTRLLSHIAGEQALVSVQNPIRLSDDSEPQPEPRADGCRLIARASRGESLASTVMPTLSLTVDGILG